MLVCVGACAAEAVIIGQIPKMAVHKKLLIKQKVTNQIVWFGVIIMMKGCSILQSEKDNCWSEQSPEKSTVFFFFFFLGGDHPVYVISLLTVLLKLNSAIQRNFRTYRSLVCISVGCNHLDIDSWIHWWCLCIHHRSNTGWIHRHRYLCKQARHYFTWTKCCYLVFGGAWSWIFKWRGCLRILEGLWLVRSALVISEPYFNVFWHKTNWRKNSRSILRWHALEIRQLSNWSEFDLSIIVIIWLFVFNWHAVCVQCFTCACPLFSKCGIFHFWQWPMFYNKLLLINDYKKWGCLTYYEAEIRRSVKWYSEYHLWNIWLAVVNFSGSTQTW